MLFFISFFFFKQKTAYEMRISDWSSDVCSSDLIGGGTSIAGVYHDPDGSMTIDAAPFAYDKYSDVLDGGGIVYDSYEWCGADPAACERPQVLIPPPFLPFQDGALVGFSLYSEPGVCLPIAPRIRSTASRVGEE